MSQCFRGLSVDQLQRPPQQSLGVAQPPFGLADGRPQILPARRNSQRTDLGELLPIPLYVFGDDRQSWPRQGRSWLPVWPRPPSQIEPPCVGGAVGSVAALCIRCPSATTCEPSRATTRRRSTCASGSTPTSRRRRRRPRGATRSPPSCRASSGTAIPTAAPSALRAAIAELARRRAGPGVRRQRIERGAADAAADLRRRRVARVATFEPTYQLHGHIARLTGATVVEGERARRLHARPRCRGRA